MPPVSTIGLLIASLSVAPTGRVAAVPPHPDAARVAVVRNDASSVSRAICEAYTRLRGVKGVISVHCPDSSAGADRETIAYDAYRSAIETPIRAYLAAHPRTDFIVMTKGVPLRITGAPGLGMSDRQPSLDSYVAALDYDRALPAVRVRMNDSGFTGAAWANRFWASRGRFSHDRFGGYLVTRLDGYTQADAIALVTRSIAAEGRAPSGTILLDSCPDFGYSAAPQPVAAFATPPAGTTAVSLGELNFDHYNADMRNAAALLTKAGVPVEMDEAAAFVGPRTGLMGYCSWGSNDRHYDPAAYHGLRFAPGGIAETAVSTSARTFLPTTGGQSLIADLVAQGAAGAKGYCDEPLLQACASPTILFDRYSRGWTLAESYYAASRFVGWEDIVLGDPLCSPYRARTETAN